MTFTNEGTYNELSPEEAVRRYIRSGATVMVGGFGRGGTPFTLLDALRDRSGELSNLTLVKNDGSEPNLGVGPLFRTGMVRGLISTHIGLNPDLIQRMNDGEIEVELIPQGIFAEKIRAAGAGILAFYSDIGVDTVYAKTRDKTTYRGQTCLIEPALPGEVALLSPDRVDRAGNCWWRGSNRNMSVVMGMACDAVIVETFEVVDIGEIYPEDVHLPGAYVTAVVKAAPRRHMAPETETTS